MPKSYRRNIARGWDRDRRSAALEELCWSRIFTENDQIDDFRIIAPPPAAGLRNALLSCNLTVLHRQLDIHGFCD